MKTLIVEDDLTSRTVLEEMLAPYGEISSCVDGNDAVDLFRASLVKGPAFDLVLMDIMMPEKSGLDALKEIRSAEERRGHIGDSAAKVIMTTALGDSKTILSAFRNACDGYLVKPVHRARLIEQLRSLKLIVEDVPTTQQQLPL